MKYDIKNKTVIITGATGGIGSALVSLLINKYNCKVFGIGRNREKAEKLSQSLGEKAHLFTPVFMDITSYDYTALSIVDKADMLINNAGFLPPFSPSINASKEDFEKVMNCNFFAQIALTQYLLPLLKTSERGAVVFISSSDALCPIAGTGAYGASKSALKAYSETLAQENCGLYVATVLPGFTKTELFTDIPMDKGLVASLASTPQKTAKLIVKGIRKRKARIITGADAHLMNFLYKLMPVKGPRLIRKILKKSKIEAFKDI
ncbi:MAG: SDR family NAD(P)-dependent oxidoreductase [Clostridiales bacterium]|nr:SDR family NAD(P)-dependent oxidoreductase [Clostridiales bacterium]